MNKENFLDKLIRAVSPATAVKRMQQNLRLEAMTAIAGRKFDAASKSRHTVGWLESSASPNTEIITALHTLRDRSRDLSRNNPYAINALRIIPNNVVGTGIMPSLKFTSKRNNDIVNKKFKTWANSVDCDYDGNLSYYGIQHLAVRTVQESGEALIVRVPETNEYDIPLRIQILEADYLDTTRYQQQTNDGGMIYYGIEFDKRGRRKGYWIYDRHPKEFAAKSRFIPAADVIHLYEVERPGQIRGIPFSKGSMIRMNDLDDYEFSERVRAKIAASFAAFVTMDEDGTSSPTDELFDKIEPGSITKLKSGENITFSNPPLTSGYPEYVKSNLRAIAVGNGVTYEAMTGDLSNVNFSSGRMGYIEQSRNIQQWQWNMMVPKFCEKTMQWFLDAAKLRGYLKYDDTYEINWTPPRREMIDPYKEILGKQEEVLNGFSSWSEVVREMGYNPDDLRKEIAEDQKAFDALGVLPSSDPRYQSTLKTDPAAMRVDGGKTGSDKTGLT